MGFNYINQKNMVNPEELISGLYLPEEIFSDEIINAIHPERLYPKWEKWEIKRKYGKHPAIHIDVWQPYLKSIFELMPKRNWR